jgi:3-oxoacyl-[acyl-carrier protein] reductase
LRGPAGWGRELPHRPGHRRRPAVGHRLRRRPPPAGRRRPDRRQLLGAADQAQPWGGDDVAAVLAELGDPPHVPIDLGQPEAPAELVARARAAVGPLSTLVAAHARSADGELATVTAAELDACWAVNARASVLLTR